MAEEGRNIDPKAYGAYDAAGHIPSGQSRVYTSPVVRIRTQRKSIRTQDQPALAAGLHIRQAIARGKAKAIYGPVYGDVHFASDGPARDERTSYSDACGRLTPNSGEYPGIPGELRAQTVLVKLLFLKILEEIFKCLLGHVIALNRGQTTAEPLYAAANSTLAFSRAGPWRGLIDGGLGDSPRIRTLAAVGHFYDHLVELKDWPDIGPADDAAEILLKAEIKWRSDTRTSISDMANAMHGFAAAFVHPMVLPMLLKLLLRPYSRKPRHFVENVASLMRISCSCLPSTHPLRLLCSISERTELITVFWHMFALSRSRLSMPLLEQGSPKYWDAFGGQVLYADIMMDLGDVRESSTLLEELLPQAGSWNPHPHLAVFCLALGRNKYIAGSHDEARTFLENALAQFEEFGMTDSWAVAVQCLLGATSEALEDWSGAELFYTAVLQTRELEYSLRKGIARRLFSSLRDGDEYDKARKLRRRYPEFFGHEKLIEDDDYSSSDEDPDSEDSDCYEAESDDDYGSDEDESQWEDV